MVLTPPATHRPALVMEPRPLNPVSSNVQSARTGDLNPVASTDIGPPSTEPANRNSLRRLEVPRR